MRSASGLLDGGFKWEGTVAQEGDAPGSFSRLARAGAAGAAASDRLVRLATADAARRRAAAKASMALASAKDVRGEQGPLAGLQAVLMKAARAVGDDHQCAPRCLPCFLCSLWLSLCIFLFLHGTKHSWH